MANWKPGDVVVLKSGGPPMTVAEPGGNPGGHPGHRVRCLWFAESRLERGEFPPETLVAPNEDAEREPASHASNGARRNEHANGHD